MAESQGTGTPHRPRTAALSRHWKIAVLAAAGLATVAGTTTIAAVTDHATADAKPTSTVTESKARANPAAAGPVRGGEGVGDSEDGDYWAEHAGNPDRKDSGKEEEDYSGSQSKEKDSEDHDKEKSSGSQGREKSSEDHDKAKRSGGQDGHDEEAGEEGEDGGQESDEGDDKTKQVECDPNDLILAITEANENSGGKIQLAENCTYTLTANQDGNGLPKIIQPITIDGNGATIARAANAEHFRIFQVGAGGDLKLSHLTLTRGKTAEGEDGGAIDVDPAGRLDLDSVTLENNTVDDANNDDGGAIYNQGISTIRNSTLNKNSAEDGSAVYNAGGKLEITSSEITNNTSDLSDGFGAITNSNGSVKISKSLLSYNSANNGGALFQTGGTAEVESSTLTHNTARSFGGAIYHSSGSLYVRKSTISYNVAGSGGGLTLADSAVIEDSKIHNNTANGSDGGGILVSLADGDEVAIRGTKISGNRATAQGSTGGGIWTGTGDLVTLTDTKVKDNTSHSPAGGIQNNGTVTTHGKVEIIDNQPTNCGGNNVPSCFG
ncbi:hypothetical protein ACWCXB_23050 [Streptomyces sp. NPDC001514]